MENIEKQSRIYVAIFVMANRLQVLGDAFDDQITLKQWLMISSMYKAKMKAPSLSDVADLIGNSRQNVKKMALILERSGYVKLQKDAVDDRKINITLTQKCLDYFGKRYQKEVQFAKRLFNGFSDAEIENLFECMKKMAMNVGVMEEEYEDGKF